MVINPYIFKREPNTFIGGLSLSTREMMATELSVSVSNVKAFSYDAINDIASCFVKNINLFNSNDSKYNGNNDLISFVSSATGVLRPYNEFRNANSVVEIRLPNLTFPNDAIANSFNIQCANLEILDIRSITRLQHNYIYSAPKLTELNVESVVYADKGAIRGVPLLMLIDMKKCKFLGTDGSASPTSPIFTGLNPNVTINLNYALMTSNGGDVDTHVVGLKVAYPNCTINFYDDNGNFVETYNTNPELYTENDACSIGTNETESIGAEWSVINDISMSVEESTQSDWCIKFVSTSIDFNRSILSISGLEIGETYEISLDGRAEDETGLSAGQGFIRTDVNNGWDSLAYADIDSFNWQRKSFNAVATDTDAILEYFPSYTASGVQDGWSGFLDNISIKKIS